MADQQTVTEDLLYAPVRHLASLIRAKRLSPVALAEAYLDRLKKFGPRLGAVVTVTRELALKEARAAEHEIKAGKYRGPLHGIPYGAKDLLATRGIPTTWGAQPYRKQVFDYDATAVRKLRAAGAVLVAKLAMVELAGGFGYNNADASFTGPGRTPWNLKYWSGGSSSGPGAAVAAALVPFAIGSETSGSIITPAAFCGIAGLRPTYGRVSRHGAMALSWTLDKLGPMCRTADDCGLVLAALAGADPLDPSSVAKTFAYTEPKPPGKKKFKIGVIRGATRGVQPEVKKNFEASLKVLGRFAEVVEGVKFPRLPFGSAVSLIIQAEGASAFRELIDSGKARELRSPNFHFGIYSASMVLAVDYLQAMRLRGRMKKALDEVVAGYDALVAPSRSTVAYPVGLDFHKAYPKHGGGPPVIPAGNIAGQPALSVPNGFGAHGLPTGIQFTGRAWSEYRLIALAHAYQQATEWHKKRPAFAAAKNPK
jgi:aspartyl-tRNA(Asn)/glutamyl-tRNA(Gln) amidotransferase subunit A